MNEIATRLDAFFGITSAGSTLRAEVAGGLTTFATMSYIVFVQPTVLSAAGMDFGSVLVATCIASAIACFVMGIYAGFPFALAPGMGVNFLFAFTICSTLPGGMGLSWQAGLAVILIAGLMFLALSIFRTREKVVAVMPPCLKHAIGPAIGLFIAFVGLQWGGIVTPNPATITALGSLHSGPALITILGVFVIAACLAWNIRGGILLGILVTCAAGLATGVMPFPDKSVPISMTTFGQFDFLELAQHWQTALVAILLVFFLDLFDTVGTLVGVSTQAGFTDEKGNVPRAGRAFLADAAGSCAGALFGTSTITTYIESSTGIAAGARTGFAAVTTGCCFLAAIVFAPLVQVAGEDIGAAFYGVAPGSPHVAMHPGVAPALIVVGVMMMPPLRKIHWEDITESLPAFLTVAMMPLGFGITEGVAMGCISYTVLKPLAGKAREVHPAMYFIAAALVARYAFLL